MVGLEWIYVINALHVAYMPYVLYRYYKYFNVYPIKMWNYHLMLMCGIAVFLHQVFILLAQLIPSLITWIAAVPLVISDSVLTDSFILQAFIVYIKFEIVNAQEQCTTEDKTKLLELEHLLRRAKWCISKRFGVMFMSFNVALIVVISIGFIIIHPDVGMVPANQCQDGNHPDCVTLVQICMLKTAFSWTLGLVMAFKLKMVFDSIGIKQNLKKISILFLFTYLIYLTVATMVPTVDGYTFSTTQIMFGYHMIFYYGIEKQVRLAETCLENSSESQSLIHQFLLHPRYFEAFFKHAKTEFNVENLCFWKDVQAIVNEAKTKMKSVSISSTKRFLLKTTSGASTTTQTAEGEAGAVAEIGTSGISSMSHKEAALAIYYKYVVDGAMLQVNLPDNISNKIHKDIAVLQKEDPESVVNPCLIYLPAMKSIEKLMNDDMLPRFKKTVVGKQAWAEFEKNVKERDVLSHGDVSIDVDKRSSTHN